MRVEFVVSGDSVLMVEDVARVEFDRDELDAVSLVLKSANVDDPWS